MQMINKNKNLKLIGNLKEAVSLSDKLLGMLKKSNTRGLIIKTRFGIHTFFLKKPIDVAVLDKNLKVVKLATVKPNKLFFYDPKHNLILELPEGVIRKMRLKLGNLIKLTHI